MNESCCLSRHLTRLSTQHSGRSICSAEDIDNHLALVGMLAEVKKCVATIQMSVWIWGPSTGGILEGSALAGFLVVEHCQSFLYAQSE